MYMHVSFARKSRIFVENEIAHYLQKKKEKKKVKKQKHEVDINASTFNINLYKTSFQILT